MSYLSIEQHGVVGDLHTVALVGMDGSIDFMCFPRFDSPTIFGSLLDERQGGHFQIAPTLGSVGRKQLYLPDSNVLLTRFLSNEGVAEISDFMPAEEQGDAHALVRRAKTVRGEIQYRMVCAPRFDYARARHRVERRGTGVVFAPDTTSQPALRLCSQIPVQLVDGTAVAEFTLRAGETAAFVLDVAGRDDTSPSTKPGYVAQSFKDTLNFWRRWVGRSTYQGRWRGMVNRSALILKLLTSHPQGSIVAAPTFGLPEHIGGERNWDYRYTWIRDASFTLYALFRLGYTREAAAFMRWIEARCHEFDPDDPHSPFQPMYRIDGGRELPEQILPHFEGYKRSRPVRIGNAAADQLQLDIYGELMDTVYLYNKYGDPISFDLWENLTRLVEWVCRHWRQPDAGFWEIRGRPQELLSSRLMCWVAVDRGIRLAQRRSFPAPLDMWQRVRDQIYRDIFQNFWDAERKSFVQHRGAKAVDAATLLMPLMKFVSPTDPRWLSTLAAIKHDLVEDSFVYRYRIGEGADDGLSGDEGTFNMCAFWYVECLSRAGDVEKARLFMEKALGHANHLGLYAEQLGRCADHLGNFPQAFTHLALISAAFDLDRRLNTLGQRG
jgi:GH15 family glucan-1,4-alpha-glucosidase